MWMLIVAIITVQGEVKTLYFPDMQESECLIAEAMLLEEDGVVSSCVPQNSVI